ncbi:MAG: PilZ domain-containing protein [Allosphingosinicella sp.]
MHGLRSALLNGGKAAAASPLSTEEECRRKGVRDPSRPPTPERIRDDRRVAAQRKSKRHREIVERATILYGGKKSLARVVNISASGITLETAIGAGVGDVVTVELSAGPVDGTVRWARKGRIGLDVGEGRIELG